MSLIGEAALSSLFGVLFDKLTSSDLLKFFQQEQVNADLNKWKKMLMKIHAVLDDAEEKQVTSKFVKIWLDELEDLAYDVDDILDEFATEALRRELKPEPNKSKVQKIINACVGSNGSFARTMQSKIAEIDSRLQGIVKDKNDLELRETNGGRTKTTRSRVPTTSLVNERHTYGRDEDKKAIIKLLLSSEFSDAQLSVISIVGMGGLGKTTLAQLVYNDEDVSHYFDLKAWACVSEDFDIVRVTKAILQSVTSSHYETNDLNIIQVKLKEKLYDKKFLLILDDVWNEDYDDWTKLRCPFEFGAPGSKIIVTTRNYNVSSTMGTTPAYELEGLSKDACWHLFKQHALGAIDFIVHPELEEIGREILNRCKGSPLAAKVLGGALRTKRSPNEWKNVLNSKIWDIPKEKKGIIPVLEMSYQYLPSHLKRCFAYCSLFPKDYEFEKNELVLLWMAEGLVQETERNKPIEDLGAEYFHDLVMRSFFQQSSNNESLFVMHDLINDLAQWAAKGLCYRLEDTLSSNKQSKISTKVRHFSYIPCQFDGIKKFEDLPIDMHLRTFLPLPRNNMCYLTNYVPNCLLPQLSCLRVISLCGYEIIELPSSIGNLKHLRYLNLSHTSIRSLPESTSLLYNLQTLMLKACHKLTKLPEKIWDLVNLRYLDITDTNLIREMPVGIEKLKNLHTLSNFVVGKDSGSKIGDLINLEFLRGRLCISSLENVLDVEDARRVKLNGKKNLDALVVKWGFAPKGLQYASIAVDILDMLRPWTTVKELSIDGYIGVKFPTWIGDHSFSNIVDLKIVRCEKCMSLPAIGRLFSLKFLIIKSMSKVQTIGPEFYGEGCLTPFRFLEKLHFEDMQEWQDWIPCGVEYGDFPCLRELFISQCPKLQGKLPNHLPSLENFSIKYCEQLVVSIPSLPILQELEIVGCKEVVSKNKDELCLLKSIIFSIPGLKSLTKEFMEGLGKVKNLKVIDCNELTSLWQDSLMSLVKLEIWSCPSLINISLTSTLKTLYIKGCGALKSLPMSNCTSLEYATIEHCNSLMFISRHQLPPTLKRLEIQRCVNLQFLIDEGEASSLLTKEESIKSNASLLEHLYISNCPSLKCVSLRGELSEKLKHLEIWTCSKLTSLSSRNQLPMALKYLQVYNCPKLESLANELPNNASLEYLKISHCQEIKFLPEGLHKLNHLNEIHVDNCCSLVSFPDGRFLPTHLRKILITNCVKLEALPRMHNLTSLQTLCIYECTSTVCFPEDAFPTNLKELLLKGVTNCKQGLNRLTSLRRLTIYGNGFQDWQSFPEEEDDGKMMMLLPTSLTSLWILNFPNIVLLSSKAFQNLSALEKLYIDNCPKLAYLPEGLPHTLLKLYVYNCPVLKQQCRKGKGQEWLKKINNIPLVKIDYQSIYELEQDEE
ncbi:putative disease resistance RPP13-like protein 1 [Castanea sativa]|uniref:putative disease resistance RPP13-like protein 1 n=1 Tax=Castanea sativa TaxID=21020 RepID=UPI003F653F34